MATRSNISPINPARACTSCGCTPSEWDPGGDTEETSGCLWPDGRRGCWSNGDDHVCRSCGEEQGLPLLDRTCPVKECGKVFETKDDVDDHFGVEHTDLLCALDESHDK